MAGYCLNCLALKEVDEEAINTCVNSNIPTNSDKNDLAKTIGVSLCTNTNKLDSRICSDMACKQSSMLKVIQHRLDIHGARNGNRTGRVHERKRYTRSNLKFTMDNGKVDRISETNLYVLKAKI